MWYISMGAGQQELDDIAVERTETGSWTVAVRCRVRTYYRAMLSEERRVEYRVEVRGGSPAVGNSVGLYVRNIRRQ